MNLEIHEFLKDFLLKAMASKQKVAINIQGINPPEINSLIRIQTQEYLLLLTVTIHVLSNSSPSGYGEFSIACI